MTDQPTPPTNLPEISATEDDTQPTSAQLATQADALIPPPPTTPPLHRIRHRTRRTSHQGFGSTIGIIALLSIIMALIMLLVLLLFLPQSYIDSYIPGRLATRTALAAFSLQTEASFSTREAVLLATQTQIARHAAATQTAFDLSVTRNALDLAGTTSALAQTATGAAVAFDATRTAVAAAAQGTASVSTLEAVQFAYTQTAAAQAGRIATAEAYSDQRAPQAREPAVGLPIPTADVSRFSILFEDEFREQLDPLWTTRGGWQVIDGQALSGVCGTTLTIGNTTWSDMIIDVVADNPNAQFAVTMGYGNAPDGTLYVNFGLNGSVWWLVDQAEPIRDEMQSRVYDPRQPNHIRIIANGQLVNVFVDDQLISERLLPQPTRGAVGLYTCPTNASIPRFDVFRVTRLP